MNLKLFFSENKLYTKENISEEIKELKCVNYKIMFFQFILGKAQ